MPTFGESGGPANFEVSGWTTIAPRGLPPAVVEKIRRDLLKALAEPDIREKFGAFGYETFPIADFAAHIPAESTRLAAVIKRAGAHLD